MIERFIFKDIFEVNESHLELTIFPRHRDKFGIRWRSNKRICTAPIGWSSHGTLVSGKKGISSLHAKLLYQQMKALLLVGSHARVRVFTRGPTLKICRVCLLVKATEK